MARMAAGGMVRSRTAGGSADRKGETDMFLFTMENLSLGWDIMWHGMVGIFAAIAVIVIVVWLFTKLGGKPEKKEDGGVPNQES